MSLRTKLIVLFIVLAIIPLGVAGRFMIQSARDELKSAANEELTTTISRIVLDIDEFYLYNWLAPARLMKNSLEDPHLGVNEKLTLLQEALKEFNDIVALQVWVEGVEAPMQFIQENFSYRIAQAGGSSGDLFRLELVPELDFDIPTESVFSAPFYLDYEDIGLVNLRLPLNKQTFGHRAFLSAWLDLSHLKERVRGNSFNAIGKITVIDSTHKCIFCNDHTDLSRHPTLKNKPIYQFINNKSIVVQPVTKIRGKKTLGAITGYPALNWVILAEKREEDAYAMANQLTRHLLIWVFFGVVIAVLGALVFSVSLTRPLLKVTDAAGALAAGDLSVQVEGKDRKDEIGKLSWAFNKMVGDLNHYIAELTETTRAKERVESELKLAWNIQRSFLPTEFPEFEAIDVFGFCDPARDVGGDYFDFFQLDDENYGLVIGDVSGKGVPASLFMAVSRTLFRVISSQVDSPDVVLTDFNNKLVLLNEETNMFITMFYAIYNLKSGKLRYSCAGHNMPFIKSALSSDEGFSMLPPMKTLVAGMMDGVDMQLAELTLKRDDCLVLYTDGVTEAINSNEEEFGEERLKKLLDANSEKSSGEICQAMSNAVKEYQKDEEQFDDITVLVMKVK